MKKKLIAGLIGTIAGCGGGGGGGGASPEGLWDTESGLLLLTADNELWSVSFGRYGALVAQKGTVATDDHTIEAQGRTWYSYDNTTIRFAVEGTFSQRETITGTGSSPDDPGVLEPFSMSYRSGYDEEPPSMVGSYDFLLTGVPTGSIISAFTVDDSGAIASTGADCGFVGTIAPDVSGKSFYRIGLTFADSAACTALGLSRRTATGVAMYGSDFMLASHAAVVLTTSDDSVALFGAIMHPW